jgi:MscS family membrane protein
MFLGLSTDQWIDLFVAALFFLGVVVIGRVAISFLLGKLGHWLAQRTRSSLDDVILEAIRAPLYGLIVIVALRVTVDRLDFLSEAWEVRLGNLFFVLYLAIGFAFAWRLVHGLFVWYGKEIASRTETNLDEQVVPFFRRLAMIVMSIIVFIILLDHFNINVSALVTTLGIGSLAIALAAQETLADTISGFVIMADRPFRIGDRVEIQELDTWGDVVDIGLRSSRIRTRDNRTVIVPNSVIGKSLIVNHSYPDTQYRIQIHIGVAYGSNLELARQTMIEAVRGVEGVLPDRPVEALFLEFGDSALIFRVRWWLESYEDTRRMFDRVNTALYNALDDAGIVIPFPTWDVHHKLGRSEWEPLVAVLREPGR